MYARPARNGQKSTQLCMCFFCRQTKQNKPNGSKRIKFEIRNKREKKTNGVGPTLVFVYSFLRRIQLTKTLRAMSI